MVKETFTKLSNGFIAITEDGYFVKINSVHLYTDKKPEIFHKQNPYTIDNINNYIKLNNIKTVLLSEEYNGNTNKMLWKCQCGNEFEKSWNSFHGGSHKCEACIKTEYGLRRRKNIKEILNVIHNNGYELHEKNR